MFYQVNNVWRALKGGFTLWITWQMMQCPEASRFELQYIVESKKLASEERLRGVGETLAVAR